MQRILFVIAPTLFSLVLAVDPAAAQYPSKPIRLVVPFAAGGPSDAAARALSGAMSKPMGQPIVIENMPGGNGAIAMRAVRTAPPDGYTLLWGVGSMVAVPLLQRSAALESLVDFAPISTVGQFTFGMVANSTVPARTVAEFVTYARANTGKVSFASATLSEFMAAAQFMKATGTTMTRVPYRGGAQAIPDLIAGRLQVYFTPVQLAVPHVKAGRLRLLGILLPQRSPISPDTPTMIEAGFPRVSVPSWQALFAPPKTPHSVVDLIARQVSLALNDPDLAMQFDQLTLRPEGSSPNMLAAMVRQDVGLWQIFIRENGVEQE